VALGLKLPLYGITYQPLIRLTYEINYIFSFGETPGSLAKCDLLTDIGQIGRCIDQYRSWRMDPNSEAFRPALLSHHHLLRLTTNPEPHQATVHLEL
jgi:hypothetical protein